MRGRTQIASLLCVLPLAFAACETHKYNVTVTSPKCSTILVNGRAIEIEAEQGSTVRIDGELYRVGPDCSVTKIDNSTGTAP